MVVYIAASNNAFCNKCFGMFKKYIMFIMILNDFFVDFKFGSVITNEYLDLYSCNYTIINNVLTVLDKKYILYICINVYTSQVYCVPLN